MHVSKHSYWSRVFLSKTACLALSFIAVSCSSADLSGEVWPSPPSIGIEEGEDFPSNQDTGGSSPSTPESTGTDPETEEEGSTTGDPTSSEESSDSPDESSESDEESSSSPSEESTDTEPGEDSGMPDPNACVQKLCAELNPTADSIMSPLELGQIIFYFGAEKWAHRLARVEIMEGFTEGETHIALKSDGGDKHGDLLGTLSWTKRPSEELDWAGADLAVPVNIDKDKWIWVEVTPAQRLFYSQASAGTASAVWKRANPSQSWNKSSAPIMFRAFCCEEK